MRVRRSTVADRSSQMRTTAWGPVVRICDERSATVDLRTRMSVAGWPAESDLRRFAAAALPLGDETD